MKKEYDFSNAERGKFYHPDAQIHIPVYLEPDIAKFLQRLVDKKRSMCPPWLMDDFEKIWSFFNLSVDH